MRRAIIEFGDRLRPGGVGLFFYAGHGVQLDGRNYLIPLGAQIQSERDVDLEAVDVARVLVRMEESKSRLNIAILDACRDNPFGRSFRSSSRGLAQIDAPSGTLIAYATSPGRAQRSLYERAAPGAAGTRAQARGGVQESTAGGSPQDEWAPGPLGRLVD